MAPIIQTNKAVFNVGYVFNTACPGSTHNLLTTSISSVDNYYLRVYACFSAAAKLKAITTVASVESTEILNADTNLTAGAAYMFDIPIHTGESINFRYTAATTDTTLKFNVDKYTG